MRKHTIQAALIAATLGAVFTPCAQAVVLYSNLVPQATLSGDQSISGSDGAIFDDVLIDNPINNPLNLDFAIIESVTVGILRNVGAGPVTVTGYYGTTTTPGNVNDFPILDNPQTAFGSVAVPAFLGGAKAVEYYTITPGSPFTVPLNLTDQPTFGEFAIGLHFSNQGPSAWALAVNDLPDTNLDGSWDSDLVNTVNTSYSLQFGGNPIYTTFALEVNGQVIPEPAALGAISVGFAGIFSRRRRT